MIGRLNLSGKGIDINGIIEEYKVASGGNVNTGDFVKFINNYNFEMNNILINSGFSSAYNISVVALSENKIFIAYGSASSKIVGKVCIINKTGDVNLGIDTMLSTNTNYGFGSELKVIVLNENKVFIAHNQYESYNSHRLGGLVCSINETTINAGTDIIITTEADNVHEYMPVVLNENKVFIAYRRDNSSSKDLYGVICTINETTITTNVPVQLKSTIINCISAIALDENKVFIVYETKVSNATKYNLYGITCIIDNSIITNQNSLTIDTNALNYHRCAMVRLNENQIFIAYSNIYESSYFITTFICEVTGTGIIVGNKNQITGNSVQKQVYNIMPISLNKDTIFIAYAYGEGISANSYDLYGVFCETVEKVVTTETHILIDTMLSKEISAVKTTENEILVSYIKDYGYAALNGKLLKDLIGVNKVTSAMDIISGIAKTSGVEGQVVKIYKPNLLKEEN